MDTQKLQVVSTPTSRPADRRQPLSQAAQEVILLPFLNDGADNRHLQTLINLLMIREVYWALHLSLAIQLFM